MAIDTARSRQLSSEKTEAILNGAMEEFLARGYAATSMDRVASAAGVSKATVYSHFKDKQGLFVGLIEFMKEEKFSRIFGPLESQLVEGEPAEVLKRIGLSLLDALASDPKSQAFIRLVFAESERFPELSKAFFSQTPTSSLQFICRYLEDHPELNLPDPEVSARIFVGTLIHHTLFQEVLRGKEVMPIDPERLVDGLIHMMVNQKTV